MCRDQALLLPIVMFRKLWRLILMLLVTRRVRYFDQGCVQAFIDQELHCHPARARPRRVARIGFRFAQGREAGRPRRGKAWK